MERTSFLLLFCVAHDMMWLKITVKLQFVGQLTLPNAKCKMQNAE